MYFDYISYIQHNQYLYFDFIFSFLPFIVIKEDFARIIIHFIRGCTIFPHSKHTFIVSSVSITIINTEQHSKKHCKGEKFPEFEISS